MMKPITYMHFKTGPWAHAGVLEHTHIYTHEHQDMRAEVAPAEKKKHSSHGTQTIVIEVNMTAVQSISVGKMLKQK